MKLHGQSSKIVSMVLAIVLIISTSIVTLNLPQFTLNTQAQGSMTDESIIGTTRIIGGPDTSRTGWLFYCIDAKTNTQITSTIACTSSQDIVDRNGRPLPSSNIRLVSRYGIAANGHSVGCTWGPPCQNGAGRGSVVKQFMLSDAGGGTKQAYVLIEANWGTELADRWASREVYLVFEPFYWHHIYKNGVGTGIWHCTTSYEWGKVQQNLGLPATGDKKIRRYKNQYSNYFNHSIYF